MKDNNEIFGICEYVNLPEFGIFNTVAKIDTGAYSGALHCSKIREIIKPNGKKILQFIPSDKNSHTMEVGKFVRSFVKSSTGHRVKRYLFDTEIVINNVSRKIRIGLSDRSDMNYEILVGRRFLGENNILVDVRKNQDLDIDKEKKQ